VACWSGCDALGPEEMENVDYGRHALESPLRRKWENIKEFYKAKLIEIDF
jgi:hypothetical protein